MAVNSDITLSRADLNRAVTLLTRLLAIPGLSGQEAKVARFVTDQLRKVGVPASAIKTDTAHKRSPIGGQMGNLIVKLPGTGGLNRHPRRLLMGHLDTVPICAGCKPKRRGSRIVSADPNTGLGADNRTGVAVALNTGLHLIANKLPHPPLTLFFPVQEETGLYGARHLTASMLGKPKLAYNFDGGSSAKLTMGGTGAYRMIIDITGIATHAGLRPQDGVSAVAVAGLAIAQLQGGGWLGRVRKPGRFGGLGTSNIGHVSAPGSTNVVSNHAVLHAEVRSHNPRFRKRMLNAFTTAFKDAVARVPNVAGQRGKVNIDAELDYEAFELKKTEPCVKAAEAAIRAVGDKPRHDVVDGGLDANWLYVHGIPTVTMGAGQENPHTVDEALNLYEYYQACRIALQLTTVV